MITPVQVLMGPPRPAVRASDSVVAVARKLRAHSTDAVLVRGDDDEYLGTLTRGMIIDLCVADGRNPATMSAATLIVTPGLFARPDEDAGTAVVDRILQAKASFLPVVDGGRLVGTITLDAIAAHLVDVIEDLDPLGERIDWDDDVTAAEMQRDDAAPEGRPGHR